MPIAKTPEREAKNGYATMMLIGCVYWFFFFWYFAYPKTRGIA
jgi:hypothetical protein